MLIAREKEIKSEEEQFLCSLSKLIVFICGGFFNVPLNDRLVYRLFGLFFTSRNTQKETSCESFGISCCVFLGTDFLINLNVHKKIFASFSGIFVIHRLFICAKKQSLGF